MTAAVDLHLLDPAGLEAVAADAVAALAAGADPHGSDAAELVAALSLQSPAALRPHLAELWRLRPNAGTDRAAWPWRGAQEGPDIDALVARLLDPAEGDRSLAWSALLESRTARGWRAAVEAIGSAVADDWRVELGLGWVGVEREGDDLRRLSTPTTCHLELPDGFVEERGDGPTHPTWHLGTEVVGRGRFGGVVEQPCASCDQPLHRLLELDVLPPEIDGPRQVVTCLRCLYWEADVLFFAHASGAATPCGPDLPKVVPTFPTAPLPEVEARLRRTPERWRLQDWGLSNGRENLSRVGGEATWVQAPHHPTCPGCSRTMPFLLQLDSLDLADGGGWLWGSGGLGYVCWCAGCQMSATTLQCT